MNVNFYRPCLKYFDSLERMFLHFVKSISFTPHRELKVIGDAAIDRNPAGKGYLRLRVHTFVDNHDNSYRPVKRANLT
ncbi:MAG: hypothetical protein ACYCZE_08710 [Thiobacillus sp.]